jgi:hypothetical protein
MSDVRFGYLGLSCVVYLGVAPPHEGVPETADALILVVPRKLGEKAPISRSVLVHSDKIHYTYLVFFNVILVRLHDVPDAIEVHRVVRISSLLRRPARPPSHTEVAGRLGSAAGTDWRGQNVSVLSIQ